MNILTKKQNFRLWQSGAFGNKLRAWRTVSEWQASGFAGPVALRTLGVGGGPCIYDVLLATDVVWWIDAWVRGGVPRETIMINEMAPDESIALQGEYLNDIYGPGIDARWGYFLHSFVKSHMRDALRTKSRVVEGLAADLLIQSVMTPSSYDDWRLLLDEYPGHVLEVSIYDRCLGDVPGRNALVWEIRKY